MHKGFWEQLEKPFLILAPMDDVTDVAFRQTIAKYSKPLGPPYVTFTEFTSADGLVFADEKGQEKLRAKLRFTEIERPVVAQIFSAVPEHMERTAALVRELGFDGVDINMGCPDRTVEKQGCGSALIKDPQRAQELIAATQRGARMGEHDGIPVSVKTRLGYADRDEIEEWLPALLEVKPAAVTLHARTRNEMSKVPAQWDQIARAVEIRNARNSDTLIVGNGDVVGIAEARAKARESGADGVMIGRGMFGNPWVMSEYEPRLEEKLEVLIAHAELFEKAFEGIKSFAVMRKHFGSYVEGFPGAKELRTKLMACESAAEVRSTIESYLLR